MTRDEQLIYEDYKDILKKALPYGVSAAIGAGLVGIGTGVKNKSIEDKIANASSVFQSSIIIGDEPTSIAAKAFVDLTHDIPIDQYKDLKDSLIRFSKTLPHPRDRKKAEKLQDDIDYEYRQKQLDHWADEDSEILKSGILKAQLRGSEWEDAFDDWQEQLDSWRETGALKDVNFANREFISSIIKDAEVSGIKITGDDAIVYFAPVQESDLKSGEDGPWPSVGGVEQALDGDILQSYYMRGQNMNGIRNWWATHHEDEDAEKVATEPYLNNANGEEILTQYKQSWQGAGGGYGKGFMQQD